MTLAAATPCAGPGCQAALLASFVVQYGARCCKRCYNGWCCLQVGLEKLQVTEESVTGMKEELIALQPQLEESTRQTEAAMEVISRESAEADKVKQVVSKEEAAASHEAATVKAIKDECEADLSEAMPLLEGAISALNTLKPADITEVKGMKSPPGGVKRVLEAICIMKGAWRGLA